MYLLHVNWLWPGITTTVGDDGGHSNEQQYWKYCTKDESKLQYQMFPERK